MEDSSLLELEEEEESGSPDPGVASLCEFFFLCLGFPILLASLSTILMKLFGFIWAAGLTVSGKIFCLSGSADH